MKSQPRSSEISRHGRATPWFTDSDTQVLLGDGRPGGNSRDGLRIEAIKGEIAQVMIQRNTLPKSASDEEKSAVATRVEQLQIQHHVAVQHLTAIRHQETTKLERKH